MYYNFINIKNNIKIRNIKKNYLYKFKKKKKKIKKIKFIKIKD